jgi:hypothetical protein
LKILFLFLFGLLLLSGILIAKGNQNEEIQYEYTFSRQKNGEYLFRLQLTTNLNVIKAYITITGEEQELLSGIDTKSYYLIVKRDLIGEELEIRLLTSTSQKFYKLIIEKNISEDIFESDIIAMGLFIVLMILLAKYVLFYEKTKKN